MGEGGVLLSGREKRTISSTQITPSCHWSSSQAMTPGGELCWSCDQAVKRPVWLTALTATRELHAAEERGCWRERHRGGDREKGRESKTGRIMRPRLARLRALL